MPSESIRLLLVEDSPDQSELILRAFRRKDPGSRITTVQDGQACLDALERSPFDAVLLDYNLPHMTGLDVLRRLREKGINTPVIMITGQGDESIAVETMKVGASDYITKTKNYFETLPAVVENAVKKYRLETNMRETSLRTRRLYEISLSITKERKIEVLAQRLVYGAKRLFETQGAVLILIHPETSEIHQAFSEGIDLQTDALKGPVSLAGVFGLAYIEKKPMVIEAADQHPLWRSTPAHEPPIRQILSVPLIQPGDRIGGVLTVGNKRNGKPFSSEDVDTLLTLSVHAAAAIDNARFVIEMEKYASTDGLTGCLNHRELQGHLDQEVGRASRYGKDFSLLMIDVDHFKFINDAHGHPAGDLMLKSLVTVIHGLIRPVDLLARYGGEEFSVVLPETNREAARLVAERIRTAVDQAQFSTPQGQPVHLSVSIGIASFPHDANTRSGLINAADQALFTAKGGGRNQCCLYNETPVSLIQRDQARLETLLQDPILKSLADLAARIDARTPYFRDHSQKILQLGLKMAEALNLSEQDIRNLQWASLFHDIGMASVPESILNKWGPLTFEEQEAIRAHPHLAELLFRGSARFESAIPVVLHHHERYDGQGYPNGLRGEEIPFLARVLSVIDAYLALISVRPYQPRMTHEEAVSELRKNAGTQFDPKIVEALIDLLKDSNNPGRKP
ncbi:MAG TPA: diguanylate cyclase [Nitrospiria bacterium]|nr:diguanylate cyclase [Nitrospiria bacterium]